MGTRRGLRPRHPLRSPAARCAHRALALRSGHAASRLSGRCDLPCEGEPPRSV